MEEAEKRKKAEFRKKASFNVTSHTHWLYSSSVIEFLWRSFTTVITYKITQTVSFYRLFRWRKKCRISFKTVHNRKENTILWGRLNGVYCKYWLLQIISSFCMFHHMLTSLFPPVSQARCSRSGWSDFFLFWGGRGEPLCHAFQEGLNTVFLIKFLLHIKITWRLISTLCFDRSLLHQMRSWKPIAKERSGIPSWQSSGAD